MTDGRTTLEGGGWGGGLCVSCSHTFDSGENPATAAA
jgi:hypothetical protein